MGCLGGSFGLRPAKECISISSRSSCSESKGVTLCILIIRTIELWSRSTYSTIGIIVQCKFPKVLPTTTAWTYIIVEECVFAVSEQSVAARRLLNSASSSGCHISLRIILHLNAFPNFFRKRNAEVHQGHIICTQINRDFKVVIVDLGDLVSVDFISNRNLETGGRGSGRGMQHNSAIFRQRRHWKHAQHHDKRQCQCKWFFHIIPLLFNTIIVILLNLAFIVYILREIISIVCFLGAIILMDCILILKGGVLWLLLRF